VSLNSPFAQGATQQLSLAAFMTWLVASALAALGITGHNQLVITHKNAWYNLTKVQPNDSLLQAANFVMAHQCPSFFLELAKFSGLSALAQQGRHHSSHPTPLGDCHGCSLADLHLFAIKRTKLSSVTILSYARTHALWHQALLGSGIHQCHLTPCMGRLGAMKSLPYHPCDWR
jgi:hypothetical protein